MSPAAAIGLRFDANNLPPGVCFEPTDNQLIRFYLLPRVRGQPDPFPGLIVEDDSAANTQPWKLFARHGLSKEVPAFFHVRTDDDSGGARKKGASTRPDRRCHGGGTWKSMKSEREGADHELLVGSEKVQWIRHNLNLNMGDGSVGWVMHEYSIAACPSHRICRISFTGHGKKRKREPDDFEDGGDDPARGGEEPVSQRARVAAATADDSASASSGSGSGRITTTAAFVQDSFTPINGEPSFPFQFQFQQQFDLQQAWTMEQMPDQVAVPQMDGAAGSAMPDGLDDDSLAVGSATQRLCVAAAGGGFLASWPSTTTTTTFDQDDVGAAAHASRGDKVQYFDIVSVRAAVAEMIAEMKAERNDTQAQPYVDPPMVEGPSYSCYEPIPHVSDMSAAGAGTHTRAAEPFMPTEEGELPLPLQQQFNDEARTVEQIVDRQGVAQGTFDLYGYNFSFDYE